MESCTLKAKADRAVQKMTDFTEAGNPAFQGLSSLFAGGFSIGVGIPGKSCAGAVVGWK